MLRVGRHRKFTANHTLHADVGPQRLFIKLNPCAVEADTEVRGHAAIAGHYPVPALHHRFQLGRWAVLVYERHGDGRPDSGLLLDVISHADLTGDQQPLDACLNAVLARYRQVIGHTLAERPLAATVSKLYGDRARANGRLDLYYRAGASLLFLPDGTALRPSDLPNTTLVTNGRRHTIDFFKTLRRLRNWFVPDRVVWAALTQGDPTDMNIGWTTADGPVWFDYDTGGYNALAGEFACFLWYQHLQGGWIVPTYNRTALADHPAAVVTRSLNQPSIHICTPANGEVAVNYGYAPSPARQHVIARYFAELVLPFADQLGITDVLDWLRPWLIMRALAVHRLGDLCPSDAALCLAYLALLLEPTTTMEQIFPSVTAIPVVSTARSTR